MKPIRLRRKTQQVDRTLLDGGVRKTTTIHFTPEPLQGGKLMPRDLDMLWYYHRYRVLTPHHVHYLLEVARQSNEEPHSQKNIEYRCRMLEKSQFIKVQSGYRSRRVNTEQMVHSLTTKGARLLQKTFSDHMLPDGKWTREYTHRQLDHDLGLNDLLMSWEVALLNRGGYTLTWGAYYNKKSFMLQFADGHQREPDAWWYITRLSDGKKRRGYIEYQLADRSPTYTRDRCSDYFTWWKEGNNPNTPDQRRKRIRLLTITPPKHLEKTREAAQPVGREDEYNTTWPYLLFASNESYSLNNPDALLDRIFFRADQDKPMSILD